MKNIKHELIEFFCRVLIRSDLLTTRSMIGVSSFLFATFLSIHYLYVQHLHDLFWICFSLIHAFITLYALMYQKVTRLTFIGEAVFGFILWNYISLSVLMSYDADDFSLSPIGAPLAPTFIVGLATWWILARYPKINKN